MSNFMDDDDFIDNPVAMNNGQWAMNQGSPPPSSRQPLTESQKKAIQAARNQTQQAPVPEPVQEEFEIPELEDDLEEEDYTAVLFDARLRLEQGRLYEMIINHELFGADQADPRAIKHVQNQIRKFAKEKMEEMLGMRQPTTNLEKLEIDFPFNQIEVTVLKSLARTASKGASENSEKFVPEVKKTIQEVPVAPKREGLNRIGSAPANFQKPQAKKLAPKASAPIQRQKSAIELPPELQNDPDANYKPLQKDPSQMTQAELIQRNKEAAERQKSRQTAKNPSALPPATYEQSEMIARQHASGLSAGMSRLVETVINLPKRQ